MTVKLDGMKELRGKLLELGAVGGRKVMAKHVRRALKPMRDEAQRLAPVQTGALKHSITISVLKPNSGSVVVAGGLLVGRKGIERIDVDVGGGEIETDVVEHSGAHFRWHLSEFGVPSRGIAAHPYFRPAAQSKSEVAVATFREGVRADIEKIARKSAKAAFAGAAYGGGAL